MDRRVTKRVKVRNMFVNKAILIIVNLKGLYCGEFKLQTIVSDKQLERGYRHNVALPK